MRYNNNEEDGGDDDDDDYDDDDRIESNHVPLCFARERGVGERRCTHQDGGRGGTKSREMSDDKLE